MSSDNDAFLLVVFDAIEDVDAVRNLLCEATGLHPTDATQWIARMPCVSMRPLPKVQAERVLDGLYDLGIAAEARQARSLPTLTPVRAVHDVACLPQGFRVKGLRGEPIHWVPWSKIELIDAAWVAQADETRAIGAPTWAAAVRNAVNTVMGRPRQVLGRRPRTMRITREPARELILVRREPQLALRLSEGDLNYSYLGERLRPTAAENFPLLLDDLCTRASDAYLTKSTRALWKGPDSTAKEYQFESTHALIDDAVLWVLWNWYQRDRKADMNAPDDSDEN